MRYWRYIEEDLVAADYGLATDEFLMNTHSRVAEHEATLRLYTYKDYCTLVGRFQNIHAELDLEAIRRNGFQYSRRLTGGGAIIMGQGQLGICLATADTFGSANTREMYHLFSRPVIAALKHLGITAELRGKNDLEVDGKKIAGLGIHANPHGGIQFHTSLLVDLDIPVMLDVLNIPLQKISDKAQIHKVEQRITTVSGKLGRQISVPEVRALIRQSYGEAFDVQLRPEVLSADEKIEIETLARIKYSNDDWIFQHTPQPDMSGMGLKKTGEGLLRTYVALKGENIKSVLITGDFSEHETLFRNIESRLKWTPADKDTIANAVELAFAQYNSHHHLLTKKDVSDVIWRAVMSAMKEVHSTYRGSCYYPDKEAAKAGVINIANV